MFDKETLMNRLDIDEEEYQVLKGKGLLPDNSEEAKKKTYELLEKGPPYNFDELQFLGETCLEKLLEKFPVEAHKFMNL